MSFASECLKLARRSVPRAADVRDNSPDWGLARSYLRTGLWVGVVVNLVAFFDGALLARVGTVRGVVALLCLAGLVALRSGASQRAIGLAAGIGFPLEILGVAFLQASPEWPVGFGYLPGVLMFSALVGGARFSSVVAAATVGVISGAYLLGWLPYPGYLGIQLSNLVLATLLLQLLVYTLARVLGAGSAELKESTATFRWAQEASNGLIDTLSTRVTSAIDALDWTVRNDPKHLGRDSEILGELLQQCRAQVPPEPSLGKLTLGERVRWLRQSIMDWTVWLSFLASVVLTARNLVAGHPVSILYQAGITVALGIILVVRRMRPTWHTRIHMAILAIHLGYGLAMTHVWFTLAPMSPPNLPLLLSSGIVVALTLKPVVAMAVFVAIVAVSLGSLVRHPGIPWVAPVTLALVYGVLGWSVDRWPRQLLDRLMRERDAAAEKIRERRRLVATLFHDLATPLSVVRLVAAEMEYTQPDEEAWEDVRTMVARMRATVAAALSGRINQTVVETGRLVADLQRLFRERLASKRLTFEVTGDRSARVRSDETLLRDSVLANLLSNAIKFSPAGATVRLSVQPGGGFVGLVLEDQGPGLPPDALSALALGEQAPSLPGTEHEDGTGFGLLLAKDYLTAMGGTMDVAARDGGGLRVLLSLPAG